MIFCTAVSEMYLGPREISMFGILAPWCRGVKVIPTAQLHSSKTKPRFCTGSNPAREVSEICYGKNL